MDPLAQPRTAKEVGDEFVGKYYQTLQNSPNDLREFYNDISTITRPKKNGTMCLYTLSNIGRNLNFLYRSGFDSVKVTSINSTHIHVGRFYVLVDGYFTLNERPEKNFTQIFSLAPQEQNYIVMLDILEFFDKPMDNNDEKVVSEEEDSVLLSRGPADMVGRQFAEQYYSVLQNNPDQLHRFYKDSSKIHRIGKNGVMSSSTLSNLDENFNMLSSGGFDTAEVTRVVSLDSLREGVQVVVEGNFKKKFIQHFFLAPQETGYFVYTDMFHFAHNPEAEDRNVVSVENSESAVPQALPITEDAAISGRKLPPDATITMLEAKNENVVSAESSSSSIPQALPIPKNAAICVRKLRPHATITMLEDVFRQFGEIRSGQTVVRHKTNYSYGFVEFMEANAAKKAIKATHVMVGGKETIVVKKHKRFEVKEKRA